MFKLLILILPFFISCSDLDKKNDNKNGIKNKNPVAIQTDSKIKDSVMLELKSIDSVIIHRISFTSIPYDVIYYLDNHKLIVSPSTKDVSDFKIDDHTSLNFLISNINQFYIDKTEEIVVGKNENEPMETDHPNIHVQGFKEGKKIFDKKIKMESHINYNPKFMDFYKFLGSLVKS